MSSRLPAGRSCLILRFRRCSNGAAAVLEAEGARLNRNAPNARSVTLRNKLPMAPSLFSHCFADLIALNSRNAALQRINSANNDSMTIEAIERIDEPRLEGPKKSADKIKATDPPGQIGQFNWCRAEQHDVIDSS